MFPLDSAMTPWLPQAFSLLSSLLSCSLPDLTPWGTKHAVLEQSCRQTEHSCRCCLLLHTPPCSHQVELLPMLLCSWGPPTTTIVSSLIFFSILFCINSKPGMTAELVHAQIPLPWSQQQRLSTVKAKTSCPPDKTCPLSLYVCLFICFYLLLHNYFCDSKI